MENNGFNVILNNVCCLHDYSKNLGPYKGAIFIMGLKMTTDVSIYISKATHIYSYRLCLPCGLAWSAELSVLHAYKLTKGLKSGLLENDVT